MFIRKFISSDSSLRGRLAKIVFGSGILAVQWAKSGLFESQGAAVVQPDLCWLPPGALVEAIGIGIGWVPRTVESVEDRFVIGIHSLVASHGGSIGFHGLIRPPRRRTHPAGSGCASVHNAYKTSAFFDVEGWRWPAIVRRGMQLAARCRSHFREARFGCYPWFTSGLNSRAGLSGAAIFSMLPFSS